MNFVFLSPNFPPHYELFCRALASRGVRVLGIGDAPPPLLGEGLRRALADYVPVVDLSDEDAMRRAFALLIHRHGRISHVESLNEHWLPVEARLREDFNVPGPRPLRVLRERSKLAMAGVFDAASIPAPRTERVSSPAQVRRFVEKFGFPVVFKPDVGVGAASTFEVRDAAALDRALEGPLDDLVVQEHVDGGVTSFDGLTDREGRIVFRVSFQYCRGVMEIVRDQLDVYYYTRRSIPPALERLGRRMVEAYDIRGRFFHAELFELPDGSYRALEMNFRPPGGFTTDLMNYACDVDVYGLYADVVAGRDTSGFEYELRYHCAHVSRRERPYAMSHEALVRELGPALMMTRDIPRPISVAMGSPVYVVRHQDEEELMRLIELVHRHA
jgi:hypothetical protein